MNAKTLLIRDVSDIDRQLQLLLNDGFIPTLGIVFSSVSLPLKELANVFVAHQIAVIGASSCGEIIADENVVRITDHAAVVMLLDIDPAAFNVSFLEGSDDNSYRLGMEAASLTQNHFDKQSLIVMASGMKVDGQALVEGIMGVVGRQTPIFGGLAGDDAIFKETWVFHNNQFCNHGVVLLSLDATREIRSIENSSGHLNRIPIIALTANAMKGDMERCIAAGMDAYLSKPFQQEELYQLISHYFRMEK